MRACCLARPMAALVGMWLASAPAPVAATERLFVLSQAAAVLTEFPVGGSNTEATGTIGLDKAPAAVALAPDAPVVYVTHPELARLSVVDLRDRKVTRTLAVPGSPFGVAADDRGRVFVGDWNGTHVSVLDARTGDTVGTAQVGRAPAHLLLSRGGERLFVANRESDSVSVVDTASLATVATVPVGRAPFAMALAPDGGALYVGNVQSGTVSVIDTATLALTATLQSGAMPYGAAVTADGAQILVTNQQAGTLAVLSPTGGPSVSIRVGDYPEGVAIAAGAQRAYVANWFTDDVSVLDLVGLKQERRIKVPGGPRAVVITGIERD